MDETVGAVAKNDDSTRSRDGRLDQRHVAAIGQVEPGERLEHPPAETNMANRPLYRMRSKALRT
jgi:hypothetical protein